MKNNYNSNLSIEQIGHVIPPYKKTHDFESSFINKNHFSYSQIELNSDKTTIKDPSGISGFLRREDALKIYELSYFSKGDIINFGTLFGLSAAIMSEAVYDSNKNNKILSVDKWGGVSKKAKYNLRAIYGNQNVDFVVKDGMEFLDNIIREKRKFGFIFVDHSHQYEDVFPLCKKINDVMSKDSFCLFHDYNDRRNFDDEEKYGVHKAIEDGLSKNMFDFYGIFGACGLFKKKSS
jgi:hypothetical protein